MPVSPARGVAFDILFRVESENAYSSDLLHSQLDASHPEGSKLRLAASDAALATEVTLGVLRWRRLLDFILQRELKKPIEKLDLAVAVSLRMGLYQLRFLGRIPARAAVNESVDLVRRARKASAATLVNAVLRRCAENAAQPVSEVLPGEMELTERLGILHSHPTWLVRRWLAQFGETRTAALLAANNRAPRLACVLTEPDQIGGVTHELEKAGLRVDPGQLLSSAISVRGGSVTATDAFRRGAISIQDEASQCIPLLLDVRPGERVLDVCSAPGGKAANLMRASGGGGSVVAADIHAHRLRAMRAQFERLNVSNIQLLQLDATNPLPFGAKFQRILVDAPCSGTGTLARHPEIRWRLKPEQLGELHRLQAAILSSTLDALAPGGRLVYSTCSLEPEENESVVAEALRDSSSGIRALSYPPAEFVRQLAGQVEAASLFDSAGYFRTFPGTHSTDGFFATILEKS